MDTSSESSGPETIRDDQSAINNFEIVQDQKTLVFAYTACVVGSFFGGFKLHLLLNRKKYNPPEVADINSITEPIENPRRFALRALFWGTVVSIVGTGTLVVATYYSYKS